MSGQLRLPAHITTLFRAVTHQHVTTDIARVGGKRSHSQHETRVACPCARGALLPGRVRCERCETAHSTLIIVTFTSFHFSTLVSLSLSLSLSLLSQVSRAYSRNSATRGDASLPTATHPRLLPSRLGRRLASGACERRGPPARGPALWGSVIGPLVHPPTSRRGIQRSSRAPP